MHFDEKSMFAGGKIEAKTLKVRVELLLLSVRLVHYCIDLTFCLWLILRRNSVCTLKTSPGLWTVLAVVNVDYGGNFRWVQWLKQTGYWMGLIGIKCINNCIKILLTLIQNISVAEMLLKVSFVSVWMNVCFISLSSDPGSWHSSEDSLFWKRDQEPSRTQSVQRLPAHSTGNRGAYKRLQQVRPQSHVWPEVDTELSWRGLRPSSL